MIRKRKVVTIIGSSRKKKFIAGIMQHHTLHEKKIVIAPGFYHHVDDYPITDAQKCEQDELMLDKIEYADEVTVCDHNGYIGQSTQKGIDHAKKLGRPLLFWFSDPNSPQAKAPEPSKP